MTKFFYYEMNCVPPCILTAMPLYCYEIKIAHEDLHHPSLSEYPSLLGQDEI